MISLFVFVKLTHFKALKNLPNEVRYATEITFDDLELPNPCDIIFNRVILVVLGRIKDVDVLFNSRRGRVI